MRIGVEQHQLRLVADVAAPHPRPAEEEALVAAQAVDHRILLAAVGRLQRVVGEVEPAEVADVLAQGELAVDMLVRLRGERRVAVELRDQLAGARVERIAVGLGPPVDVVAGAVELAAAVVEAVPGLVPDHRADAAVVDRVVAVGVEERRLQDRGREVDRVGAGAVVRVHRLRGHVPFVAIGGLADLVEVVAVVEAVGRAHVAEVVGRRHREAVPAAPLVRVTDLGQERLPFPERLGLGFVAHPVEVLDPRLERVAHVVDQLLRARLGLRREIVLHVQLAERFAHAAVDRVEHALPARALLGLAVEGLAVEIEVRVLEILRQVRGRIVDAMEGEVVAPLRGRHVGEHPVEFGEELRLRQREAVGHRYVHRLEERGPVEMRGDRIRLGHAHEVVAVLRVAQFHPRQRGLGQPRFEREDAVGLGLRIGGGNPCEFEQPGDVGDVGRADVLVLVLRVVIGRGQAEPALVGECDLPGRILVIGAGTEAEALAFAVRVRVAEPGDDIGGAAEFRNRVEVGLDRVEAGLVDRRLVHARAVEPADLAFDRTGLGLVRLRVRGFGDLVLRGQALLAQLVERAPARAIGGNRIRRDPLAVGVGVEVLAGGNGRVELLDVEHGVGGLHGADGEGRGKGEGEGEGEGMRFGSRHRRLQRMAKARVCAPRCVVGSAGSPPHVGAPLGANALR